MASKAKALGIGILALVVLIVVAVVLSAPNTGSLTTTIPSVQGATFSAPIFLTDPPHVPAGTQSLAVSYSSLMLHTSSAAHSGWINASGSGTLNLMGAVNSITLIGNAIVDVNSTINLLRLNVTSATITINGTSYNVTVPSGSITLAVTGRTKLSPQSGLLIDFVPVVTAVFRNNQTTFVMAPSARAVVLANATARSHMGMGESASINSRETDELRASALNITVSSASLSVAGNVTTLSVTVMDNSNASVVLRHVLVFGREMVNVSASNANITPRARGEIDGMMGGSGGISGEHGMDVEAAARTGIRVSSLRMLSFEIASNGTLTLPSVTSDFEDSAGYVLTSGSSSTFSFTGRITNNDGVFQVKPIAGTQYSITVVGEEDAASSTAVTAT